MMSTVGHTVETFEANDAFSITGDCDTNEKLVMSREDSKKYILNLFEDLDTIFMSDDKNNKKYCNDIILIICQCIKSDARDLEEEDNNFKQQMDCHFNLLRTILRSPKLDVISRTMILEVIELRAANWEVVDDINDYYSKKLSELRANELKSSKSNQSLGMSVPINYSIDTDGSKAKPIKVTPKMTVRDEVVIRNGDSGKVPPGAKERLVQITGPSEENIECAKQLIENTITRNASPVPFECTNKPLIDGNKSEKLDFNDKMIDNSNTTEEKSDDKKSFTFIVNVDEDVIQLSTNNYQMGVKAKNILQKVFIERQELLFIDSYSDSNVTKNCGHNNAYQRQSSSIMLEAFVNNSNIERSSSQGTVTNTRTSLRFMSQELSKPDIRMIDGIISYERDFLLRCRRLQLKPTDDVINIIKDKTPDIIRTVRVTENGSEEW